MTTRAPPTAASGSSSNPVSAKCPRWLVPNWSSKPSAVSPRGGIITPALLISMSIRGWSAAIPAANPRTDSSAARSSTRASTAASGVSAVIRSRAASPLARSRAVITTVAPAAASARAVSRPRPLLAPVTTARRPL